MVLFYNDRFEYKNLIYDWDTENKSFVSIAGIYKLMDVKNHAFMLVLHNPLLKGINPHDPNLSIKYQKMVIKECFENPWYFFREVVKAPPLAGTTPSPFRANRGNIATLWLFFNHIMTLLIQPRQTGKSFTVDSLMTGLLNVWCANTKINLLTKDEKLRAETVARIKEIINYLPKYIIMRTKKDSNNSESIDISLLKNIYKTNVAQSSAKAAANAARGLSSPIMHIDEFAYYKHIDTALPAALPATGAAMEDAARQGAPYGVLLTTTSGWLNSDSGKYAYRFYSNASIFTEKMYDMPNLDAVRKFIRANSRDGLENVVLDVNHRQLGFTDAWLKKRIMDSMSDGDKAETDFLNIWADGSATSPFDKSVIKAMNRGIVHEPEIDISGDLYALRWYINPREALNMHLVMGVDTSDAVGKDDIGVVIRCIRTGKVVAAGEYNETNTIAFAEWLGELLLKYKHMVMIMERRSSGTSMLDFLIKFLPIHNINPFTRIFNWAINDKVRDEKRYNEVLNYGDEAGVRDLYRRFTGFATSGSGRTSRNKLYGEVLQESMKFTHKSIFDKKLAAQISQLMVRNGRIDHQTEGHDDLVIAWLLGYWFITRAENTEAYGIESKERLSSPNQVNVETLTPEEKQAAKRDKELKFKINEYLHLAERAKDEFKLNAYLHRIRKLRDRLSPEAKVHTNVDEALKEISIFHKDRVNKSMSAEISMGAFPTEGYRGGSFGGEVKMAFPV